MIKQNNILEIAYKQPFMQPQLPLLLHKEKQIPGSVTYSIDRYAKDTNCDFEDTGIFVYNNNNKDFTKNYLELKFCISGNFYCKEKKIECDFCKYNSSKNCLEKVESVDVLSFSFSPAYLKQFAVGKNATYSMTDEVLSFSCKESFSKILPICGKTRWAIEALLNHNYTDSLENIFLNAQTQILLLYSLECMMGNHEEKFNCKFLANAADREKITNARAILIQHIGEPLTIKALSRKVAINECYLKKGFKELFGTTIFDFYQTQRMEHAKYLLLDKALSVTEVSSLLGYSSISHFSTAFKNHTGIKPCELLFN